MSHGEHWQEVYRTRPPDQLSWFQATPTTSVRLIQAAGGPRQSVIDVGGGASMLADVLLAGGFTDITVLDVSAAALSIVRTRLRERSPSLQLVEADVLRWRPERTFDVWHDRAVFHFLTDAGDRQTYVRRLEQAVAEGGTAILATFAADGPTHCSGLPVARYDAAALAAELGQGFELVGSEREEHLTPAGVMQPFTWVVMRRR